MERRPSGGGAGDAKTETTFTQKGADLRDWTVWDDTRKQSEMETTSIDLDFASIEASGASVSAVERHPDGSVRIVINGATILLKPAAGKPAAGLHGLTGQCGSWWTMPLRVACVHGSKQ